VVTGIRVEAPDRVTVGDRVRVVITLDAGAGTDVSLAPGALPRELSLAGPPEVRRQDAGPGHEQITLTLEVAPFFLGRNPLDGLRRRYTDPAGTSGEVTTPGFEIAVVSTLSGDAEPRPLKPQATFPDVGTPAWVAFAAAA